MCGRNEYFQIYAETKAKNEEFEIFQSIESKVTADLNLIKETKIENTQLLTKSITTEYHQGHGKLEIYFSKTFMAPVHGHNLNLKL